MLEPPHPFTLPILSSGFQTRESVRLCCGVLCVHSEMGRVTPILNCFSHSNYCSECVCTYCDIAPWFWKESSFMSFTKWWSLTLLQTYCTAPELRVPHKIMSVSSHCLSPTPVELQQPGCHPLSIIKRYFN
jgi:hypothetical protein